MGQIGKLDTDTNALTNRINAHAKYGAYNLEDWAFKILNVQPGQNIIELGCGTGKQTIPLAKLAGPDGHITAIDISEESINILRQQAQNEGLAERISTVVSGLDDTKNYAAANEVYDCAVACYSVYYANEPEKVFNAIVKILKDKGKFFFCGPSQSNNAELKEFYSSLPGSNIKSGASPFMEEEGQSLARRIFCNVELSTFENPLSFNSPEALYEYWKSYNLYDPQLDKAFQDAAIEHFKKNQEFTTFKRVIGVLAIK